VDHGFGVSQTSGNSLPAHRAFVVHFGAAGSRGRWCTGRVEHLISGASIHFTSLRGLLAFIAARLEAAPMHEKETP
jgi:hypothetical protein